MVCHTVNEPDYGIMFLTWTPRPLCKKDCDSMDGNRHKANAQHSPSKGMPGEWHFAPKNLHVIPEALIYEIFGGVLSSMPSSSE